MTKKNSFIFSIVFIVTICFQSKTHATTSFTSLQEAITKATALLNSTTEGTAEGEFPVGSKADLQTAIDSAIAFLGTDTTQSRIDSEISELYDDCSTYESLVITMPVNLVDKKANKQIRYLYLNLKNQMNRSLLFGMQDATGYGVGCHFSSIISCRNHFFNGLHIDVGDVIDGFV